jgi:anaerobic magnesium-protoporphyrin IX monomethyl ester cyclase
MISGFPGERVEDVNQSVEFLGRHHDKIERIVLNRFQIMTGTSIDTLLRKRSRMFPEIELIDVHDAKAEDSHHYAMNDCLAFRRALNRLLIQVHRINRKKIRESAKPFEGAM